MQKYDLVNLEWQQFELLAYNCLRFDIGPSITFIEGGSDKGWDFSTSRLLWRQCECYTNANMGCSNSQFTVYYHQQNDKKICLILTNSNNAKIDIDVLQRFYIFHGKSESG